MAREFSRRQKFFVRHLPLDDQRRTRGQIYQVQVVDRTGLARAFAFFGDADLELVIDGRLVPMRVLDAARRQPAGAGDFVDVFGAQVLPKDLGD